MSKETTADGCARASAAERTASEPGPVPSCVNLVRPWFPTQREEVHYGQPVLPWGVPVEARPD